MPVVLVALILLARIGKMYPAGTPVKVTTTLSLVTRAQLPVVVHTITDRVGKSTVSLVATSAANDGNWYPLVKRRWVQKGMKISLTEAEWNEHIAPHLPVDDVITVRRYNSKDKKITLDRIYVTSEDNKSTVYFDGKEYAMHKLGYILTDSDQQREHTLTPDEAQS